MTTHLNRTVAGIGDDDLLRGEPDIGFEIACIGGMANFTGNEHNAAIKAETMQTTSKRTPRDIIAERRASYETRRR